MRAWSGRTDPVRALASTVSLIGTLQWGRSDHPFKGGSFEFVTDPVYSAQRFNAVIDQLESGTLPTRHIHHVLYKNLVTDPLGELDKLYQALDLPLSEAGRAAMAKYVADHPRDARPAHRFNAGSPEALAQATEAYQRYTAYFQVPRE